MAAHKTANLTFRIEPDLTITLQHAAEPTSGGGCSA
jgi:hypothetical protein